MTKNVDRNLALEIVRVTEAAALAAARHLGQGDEFQVDQAAAKAMWQYLNRLPFSGRVTIGEDPDGASEHLHTGASLGQGNGHQVDIAVLPVEGTSIVARGGNNAVSVVAIAEKGGFPPLPDLYMDKIAVGGQIPDGTIDLDDDADTNLQRIAAALDANVGDLVVCILDRPRHRDLIAEVRVTGARVRLIKDGDVSAAIATTQDDSGIDVYMGIGGCREGILAAAAMKCLNGRLQGRLVLRSKADEALAREAGLTNRRKKYNIDDLCGDDVMLAATGITDGTLLGGVRRAQDGAVTHSLSLRALSGTVRYVESHHDLLRKPPVEDEA